MKRKNIKIISFFVFIVLCIAASVQGQDYSYPGNKKVLVYAPGYSGTHNGEQNEIADDARDIVTDAEHFNYDLLRVTRDSAASVELVKEFGAYGTVIMPAIPDLALSW